ncbi:hypothetical protein BX070DRAFT_48224 [Coemansia spiralis]|nr:hypothetical protein BX070DRAFT_48224 [Coemansia spiralis]
MNALSEAAEEIPTEKASGGPFVNTAIFPCLFHFLLIFFLFFVLINKTNKRQFALPSLYHLFCLPFCLYCALFSPNSHKRFFLLRISLIILRIPLLFSSFFFLLFCPSLRLFCLQDFVIFSSLSIPTPGAS